MRRRLLLIGFLAAARASGASPPTLAPADSLLAEARTAHYAGNEARAIPIFRSYLERHPDDRSVRLDLANAYAWSGRAEEAIPLYRGLLAGAPEDPVLLRAHADCLRWAGRDAESLDAYRLLPEPHPEPAVRDEIARLRRAADAAATGESILFHDSGDVTAERHRIGARALGGYAGNIGCSIGMERLRSDAEAGGSRTPWGRTLSLVAGRSLGAGRSILLDAGAIGYPGGPTHPRVEVRLRAPITRRLPAEFRAGFRDRAFDLRSVRAYAKRIDGLEASASAYASMGRSGGLYARARAGRHGDGNRYGSIDLSADAAIIAGLRLAAAATAVDHAKTSADYYAAREELALAGHLLFDRALGGSTYLRLDGWMGRIGNVDGRGDCRGIRCRIDLPLLRTLGLRVEGEIAESRQAATYTSRLVTAGIDWKP